MIFLFENTLIPYIYSVFSTLISWAHPATILATSKLRADTTPTATPSPRSEQPHTMSNHNKNGIRAHNDRRNIATI